MLQAPDTVRRRRRLARARGFAIVAVALLVFPAVVLARSSYGVAWSNHYPSSASYSNASCDLCHAQGDTGLWNPYGWAVHEEYGKNGGDIDAALTAVESLDSDGDPGGKTNLEEITAGTQPGWTDGNNNTIFDASGASITGQPPTAGIAGSLDPAASDTTPPDTTILTGPASPTKLTSASFTFSANETSTFLCSLDASAFTACTSPKSYVSLLQGSHTFKVQAKDTAGNLDATPASKTWTIDTTLPVAKAPASSLALSAVLGTSTAPVKLTWSATDASGIKSYQLQQRTDASTSWVSVGLPTATTTSLSRALAPGHSYQFRVRATDKAGNLGAWATGATFSLGLAEGTVAAKTGTWTSVTTTAASGGSYQYASAAGATFTYTFSGRQVAWIAPKTATSGQAKVYLDGVLVKTVDLYAATTANRVYVYTKAWTTVGAHTLKVSVVGTAGHPRVYLDAFVRLY